MLKNKSITTRTTLSSIIGSFLLAVIALFIGLSIYSSSLVDQYVDRAFETARHATRTATGAADSITMAKEVMEIYRSLTPEQRAKVGTEEDLEYFSSIDTEMSPGGTYNVLVHAMSSFIIGVEDVYLGMYDADTSALVYIVDPDSNEESRLALGEWEEVSETECTKFMNWDGEGKLYDISDTEKYGWLCTAGFPIRDENGEVCEFVLVDVSVNSIADSMNDYAIKIRLELLIAALAIAWFMSRLMKRMVADPVNSIAKAAVSYGQLLGD